jgi:hypothetical protein
VGSRTKSSNLLLYGSTSKFAYVVLILGHHLCSERAENIREKPSCYRRFKDYFKWQCYIFDESSHGLPPLPVDDNTSGNVA